MLFFAFATGSVLVSHVHNWFAIKRINREVLRYVSFNISLHPNRTLSIRILGSNTSSSHELLLEIFEPGENRNKKVLRVWYIISNHVYK